MFKYIHSLFTHFRYCTLCEQAKVQPPYHVCADCWRYLNVQQQYITKQDISILVATTYQFPVNKIIQHFKYNQQLQYINIFHDIINQLDIPKVQAIVAMPISNKRLTQRGYNQAQLLAKIIAKKQKIPTWAPIKRIHTNHQQGQSRIERLSNINQQFKIKPQQRIKYRKVLIIDDVVTTGSSIQALKAKLHQMGCTHVDVICIATA